MIRPPARLRNRTAREIVASYVMDVAPDGCVVSFRENTRTLEQNDKLHAVLTDIAKQKLWHGQRLPVWKWKRIFMAHLLEVEVVPGIDPGTFVPMYKSTTELTVPEMSDMIELATAWGAQHGVVFSADAAMEAMAR